MSNKIQSDRKFKRLYDIIREVAKEQKVKLGTASEYMTHFIKWQVDSLNKMETQEWLWSNFGSIYVNKRYERVYDGIKDNEMTKRAKRDDVNVVAANEDLSQQVTESLTSEETNNINNNN